MIQVLQDWFEIGEANKFLSRLGLPKHATPEKNWDLYNLHSLADPLARSAWIIDLGCGDLYSLKMLYAMGFRRLVGIDYVVALRHRISQLKRIRSWPEPRSYFRLSKQDITHTSFSDKSFDLAVCISVIEHGVNLAAFFKEAGRIIKPGGLLFVSTDYWESGITAESRAKPFGLPWQIFSRDGILDLIDLATNNGFMLSGNDFPGCSDRPVVWGGQEYTFVCLTFIRS